MGSVELRGAAEGLRRVAGRLDPSPGRDDQDHRDVQATLELLADRWRSPDGDTLQRQGRMLLAAVEPVPEGLQAAAEAVRTLASDASALSDELVVQERARQAASAAIAQASRRATSADPEDAALLSSLARQHGDATRDLRGADAAVAQIEARWWAACERCSAVLHGASDQVRSAEVAGVGADPRSGFLGGILGGLGASWRMLLALALREADGRPQLRIEGDQAVVTGTDGADLVELYEEDGQLRVRVSGLDERGELVEVVTYAIPDHVRALTVRTGDGNDIVSVPPGVADGIQLTFNVGEGNNVVGYVNPDGPIMSISGGDGLRILAGDGDNVIHGSAGDDRIVVGGGDNEISGVGGTNTISAMGGGNNRIQGGTGRDTIATGDGNDYIDGGRGADHIRSTGGDNILVAGDSDGDHLTGGIGDDTFVGGRGQTHVSSVGGDDRLLYAGASDGRHTYERAADVGGSITLVRVVVSGRPGEDSVRLQRPDGISDAEWTAWVDRVESDMEMLRHTPSGAAGLDALDQDVGRSGWFWNRQPAVTVSPIISGSSGDPGGLDVRDFMRTGNLSQSSVASSTNGVFYDTDARLNQDRRVDAITPAAIVLYHELAHAYDQRTGAIDGLRDVAYDEVVLDADGNEVSRRPLARRDGSRLFTAEINSVGYDQEGTGRITDDDTLGDHPGALTEFEVRRDLGLDPRTGYVTDPGDVPEGGRVVYEERP